MKYKKPKTISGSCLCGAVSFELSGKLDGIWFCHCTQCRKNYGMYGAFIGARRENFKFKKGAGKITWYQFSAKVSRGFCSVCGSPIAWDRKDTDNIYALAGLLDGKVGTKEGMHIYTQDKGDYYQICDSLPKFKTVPK